ncbi:MAG: hypothetical protein R2788_04450 [Saprospiraceae bacterium]
MTKITTQRLQLLALNKPQLQLYIDGPVTLARHLNLSQVELAVDPGFWAEVPDAIEKSACSVAQHPDHFEWFSHWVMIRQRQIGWSAASASADCRTRGSVCWLLRG